MTESNPPDSSLMNSAVPPELLLQWLEMDSVEKLAGRVSHDLIQPLSEIVNHVWLCRELAGRSPATAELHQTLSHIENLALRAAEMIRVVRRLACSRSNDAKQTFF